MEGKERAEWRTERAQGPAQEAVWESHGAWQTGSVQPVRRQAMPCSQLESCPLSRSKAAPGRRNLVYKGTETYSNILSEFY